MAVLLIPPTLGQVALQCSLSSIVASFSLSTIMKPEAQSFWKINTMFGVRSKKIKKILRGVFSQHSNDRIKIAN